MSQLRKIIKMTPEISPEQMIEDAFKKARKKTQWLKDIADRMFYKLATGQSITTKELNSPRFKIIFSNPKDKKQ
jgi:hypothetical protein